MRRIWLFLWLLTVFSALTIQGWSKQPTEEPQVQRVKVAVGGMT